MTNEEFQRIVLQQMADFKDQLAEVKTQIGEVRGQLGQVRSQMGEINSQMSEVKGQLDENTQFIKVFLHRTEELDAKFDGLLHTTVTKDTLANLATKDDVAALDSKLEVLNSRLFHQEAELVRLKR
ncbi:hypothetical protein AXX12_08710 [Anaerosporomusa subterranea]|uniref:Uncharacterized protein n=1 Tax=Anaerosporomusa subterranea TaxID=1794912 RepID=A0A154BR75_ANASB|nr:hypothetical protein [Anaerosporomusa subterranea]KYZ76504.1 hypothetical protein AXX12_08710 [Anaerosporomusa subterranea]